MPWTVSTVETVLGHEKIEKLGRILPHEHLCSLVRNTPPPQNSRTVRKGQGITLKTRNYTKEYPYSNESNLVINDSTLKTALEYDLRLLRSRGGKTILENTSYDYGESDLQQIKALSRATGVNIILGSGFRQRTSQLDSVESAYNKFFGDLVEGIATPSGHSEVRAGFIGKIDLNWPLRQSGRNILAAAGEVQDQIKCVVSMAPGCDKKSSYQMLRYYSEGGGADHKVLMLHLDRVLKNAEDVEEYFNRTRCYIGLDTFDNESFYYPFFPNACTSSDAECIECIINAKKIPRTWFTIKKPLKHILLCHNVQYKNQLKSFGGNGFVHIYDSILPALRKVEDFTKDEIDMLTVDNAQHWLRQ